MESDSIHDMEPSHQSNDAIVPKIKRMGSKLVYVSFAALKYAANSQLTTTRSFIIVYENHCELTAILHADASEQTTIDQTIEAILQIPSFIVPALTRLEDAEHRMKLRNYISYVIQEETVTLPYVMQHPPQNGQRIQQRMLYIPTIPRA